MNTQDLEAAQTEDLRKVALSWENYRLALEEFHVAVKFFEWERAEIAREKALGNIEANLDAYMALHRRNQIAQQD